MMAAKQTDVPNVPSILDRLIDEKPSHRTEEPQSPHEADRELRSSLQRDLQNLFNTRSLCVVWDESFGQLRSSLANYGIPDITGISLTSRNIQELLVRTIGRAIERFEPRLKNVNVQVEPTQDGRTAHVAISGMLQTDVSAEIVEFRSNVGGAAQNH